MFGFDNIAGCGWYYFGFLRGGGGLVPLIQIAFGFQIFISRLLFWRQFVDAAVVQEGFKIIQRLRIGDLLLHFLESFFCLLSCCLRLLLIDTVFLRSQSGDFFPRFTGGGFASTFTLNFFKANCFGDHIFIALRSKAQLAR